MKNKYDTSVVFLYATGNEHLLPAEFRKSIPYSTISDWRKSDCGRYIGHEFRYLFDDAAKAAAIKVENTTLRNLLAGITRSWVSLSPQVFNMVKDARKDKALQLQIIECIEVLKKQLGLERALKLFGLSKSLYSLWVLEARVDCWDSFLSLCVKRHPYQLQLKEVRMIEKMLKDPELEHWPIVSVAGLGMRKGKIVASMYSWYKYARLLNLTEQRKVVYRQHKKVGLRAAYPNEYLHVDTTYYPMNDTKVVCIAFVMDNYSKMILGYHVAEKLSFEVVKEALSKALETIMQHPDQHHSYLVADGGSENHNRKIDQFISELSGHELTKIRALKDIRFSNSMVEAIHKTMKSRYLQNRKFELLASMVNYLDAAVKDYNEVRPHYKHRLMTPREVYFNQNIGFDQRARVKKAIRRRVKMNKSSKCSECQCVKTNQAA